MNDSSLSQDGPGPLDARLRRKIGREGPISFRDWMAAALYDPSEGYYCRRDRERWGRTGDYRTSPERSPLFAATFAGYFARLYEELGAPSAWTICEAGAGAGHFARGVLETLERSHPALFQATRYLVDERSEDALERARERLSAFTSRVEFRRPDEPERPLGTGIVFSNELLDAFPVYRVRMRGGKMLELCVGLDAEGAFIWLEREPESARLRQHLEEASVRLEEGRVAEIHLDAADWLDSVNRKLERGFVVTVDYGAEASELYSDPSRSEGTLRAFARHRLAENPLAYPGLQDLTTTIDWTLIRTKGERLGWRTVLFERQDRFLLQQGILDQLERLTARAPDSPDALILRTGLRDLVLPVGMSASFQVLVQHKR